MTDTAGSEGHAYREASVRPFCSAEACRELANRGCKRCAAPLCDHHLPSALHRCERCEAEYAARTTRWGVWNGALALGGIGAVALAAVLIVAKLTAFRSDAATAVAVIGVATATIVLVVALLGGRVRFLAQRPSEDQKSRSGC